MGTIADKLSYLDTTRERLLTNINALGGDLTEEDTFRSYADELDNLWENETHVTGTGETLTLTTKKGKAKVNLNGNTSQAGTPTPDLPIPVHVVSGDNTIKVEGKNLLSLYNMQDTYTSSNMTASFSNGELNINGNSSASDGTTAGMNCIFTLTTPITLESGTYTINATLLSGTFTCASQSRIRRIALFGEGISLECFTANGGTTFTKGTVTISETKTITSIQIIIYGACNFSNAKFGIQLEKSNQATTYEAYIGESYPINLGDIELCKIGTYQDSIVKDNGKWYLNKQIGKVTLSNSDSFTLDSYSLRFTKVLDTTYEQEGYSNRYIYGSTYQTTGKFEILSNGRLAFSYPSSNIDTVAKLQTYLTTNELYMYLPLSTPTYEEITDSTLIGQLEQVWRADTYKGQTNISQENNDMPFELDVIGLSGE